MRLFEILLIALCFADAAARIRYASRRPMWATAIPLISFLFAIIHLAGESARWQMIPIYLVVLSAFTILLARSFQESSLSFGGDRLSRGTGMLIVILSTASLILGTVLPVFELPAPTGDYVVGTVEGKLEPAGTIVRFHYPADRAQGERAPYTIGHLDTHLAYLDGRYGIPSEWLAHLAMVRTFSFPEAEISTELPRFRILIACPDLVRPGAQSTALAEELASRGFVVISRPEPTQSDSADGAAFPEAVVTWLETLRSSDRLGWLSEKLNFATVGIYGIGEAGGAAVEASTNSSFRAGASVGAQPISDAPTLPFMYIQPGDQSDTMPDSMRQTTYRLTIASADVDNFGDDAFVSPMMPALGKFGPISPDRSSEIVGAYLGAFFNKHLTRGTVEPILDDNLQTYPEVTLEVREIED